MSGRSVVVQVEDFNTSRDGDTSTYTRMGSNLNDIWGGYDIFTLYYVSARCGVMSSKEKPRSSLSRSGLICRLHINNIMSIIAAIIGA